MGLRMLTATTDEDEALIQTISERISMLGKSFDGLGEAFLASGAELHRNFEALSCEYAVLEETRGLELLVVANEYEELVEKHRAANMENTKVSKKLAALDTKYKFELLRTFEAEEKCAALEVKIEAEVRERKRAEQRCREAEEKCAFEVSEKAKIQSEHAFLWSNYQSERAERLRVEERCNVVEKKHEVEVSERPRVEEKYRELEEMYELERLERFNVEHEYKLLDEEKRRFEKECGELEKKNGVLIEAKKRLEVEGKQNFEKEYAELWEKHKLEVLEKVRVEIMYRELEENHRKIEMECRELEEKHDFVMLEKIEKEEECKEVAEKYRLEVIEREKVEDKCKDLAVKYRIDMLEMLKEYNELQESHQLEKLEIERKCKVLEGKIEYERLLRARESEKSEELVKLDEKYTVLLEKYEFKKLEDLKIQNEYKELLDNHRIQLLAKINAENELNVCQAHLVDANERYERLLMEAKKARKAVDNEVILSCQRQDNNLESQNTMFKETFVALQTSGLDKWMNAKSMDSRDKELRSENGGMTNDRKYKNPSGSPDHIIESKDAPDFVPKGEISPRNGGLHTSGTSKFSSEDLTLISDSDDDCGPGGKKQMKLKRKRDSSPNTSNNDCGDILEQDTVPTAIKQPRKLSRCNSSAISEYGKQNSSSHAQILLGTREKRGTQKSRIESPAVASNEPFDCDGDSSSSIFSSDCSEDEDGLQSMFCAVVEKAKA